MGTLGNKHLEMRFLFVTVQYLAMQIKAEMMEQVE